MNILKSVVLVMFFCSLLSSCKEKVYECVCTYEANSVISAMSGEIVVMGPTSLTRSEAKAEEISCERLVGTNSGYYGVSTNGALFSKCSFNKL